MLQTEELNTQQAMQKAEEIHQFRQYRSRILSIRGTDQEERLKLKEEVLETYGEMRVSLAALLTTSVRFLPNRKKKAKLHICAERIRSIRL